MARSPVLGHPDELPGLSVVSEHYARPMPTLADVQSIFKSQEFIQPDEENSLLYVKTRVTGMDQTGNQKIFTA